MHAPAPHLEPAPIPRQRTPLVGRRDEIAAVLALLNRENVPLVTLLGPGGVGKTRLALAVAHNAAETFPDGVVFVPLAPIDDPTLVLPAIARALGVGESSARPLPEQLAAWFGERRLLLVLDNLEQVLAATPHLSHLLAHCPALKILATSRTVLRISGEHHFPVSPLGLPDLGKLPALPDLAATDAVALFLHHARAVDPGFDLTTANAPTLARICARLDGLPLAIELAAARLRVLSPELLLARLDDRLRVLTGGSRDQPTRLQSMRDAIAWSHDLLSPAEERLFRRLAVFSGGFTLDAAEAVGGQIDTLTALVDQSLVYRMSGPEAATPRFGLLETVREFALERLAESGEADLIRKRHAEYFLNLAEELARTPSVPEKDTRLRHLDEEFPNLRLALEWTDASQAPEMLLRFVVALWDFWYTSLHLTEGCFWLDRAIAVSTNAPPSLFHLRAMALAHAANSYTWRGQLDRAAALVEEGLALSHASGDDFAISLAMYALGQFALWTDDLDLAETNHLAALERLRQHGDQEVIVIHDVLSQLGFVAALRGDQDTAEARFTELLAIARAAGWRIPIAGALEALGTCARERGDYLRASALFGEALALLEDRGDPGLIRNCLKSLGAIAAVAGQPERAARLFGASEFLWEIFAGGAEPAVERARYERAVAPARAQLSPESYDTANSFGRTMPLQDAIGEALGVAREVGNGTLIPLRSSDPADQSTQPTPPAGLTPREQDVLRLLAAGKSNRQIGAALFISPRTAQTHVTNLLAKLGLANRTEAAAFAHRHGLA